MQKIKYKNLKKVIIQCHKGIKEILISAECFKIVFVRDKYK